MSRVCVCVGPSSSVLVLQCIYTIILHIRLIYVSPLVWGMWLVLSLSNSAHPFKSWQIPSWLLTFSRKYLFLWFKYDFFYDCNLWQMYDFFMTICLRAIFLLGVERGHKKIIKKNKINQKKIIKNSRFFDIPLLRPPNPADPPTPHLQANAHHKKVIKKT